MEAGAKPRGCRVAGALSVTEAKTLPLPNGGGYILVVHFVDGRELEQADAGIARIGVDAVA